MWCEQASNDNYTVIIIIIIIIIIAVVIKIIVKIIIMITFCSNNNDNINMINSNDTISCSRYICFCTDFVFLGDHM